MAIKHLSGKPIEDLIELIDSLLYPAKIKWSNVKDQRYIVNKVIANEDENPEWDFYLSYVDENPEKAKTAFGNKEERQNYADWINKLNKNNEK